MLCGKVACADVRARLNMRVSDFGGERAVDPRDEWFGSPERIGRLKLRRIVEMVQEMERGRGGQMKTTITVHELREKRFPLSSPDGK